jgi:hypothetical protein
MTRRKAENVFPLLAVFISVGPLIGLVVCAIGLGLQIELQLAMERHRSPQLGNVPLIIGIFMFFGIFLAHKIGMLAAAIAGLLVAGYSIFWNRVPLIFGGLAGAVSYASTLAFPENIERVMGKNPELSVTIVIIAVHILPAIACTRLTRRWQ